MQAAQNAKGRSALRDAMSAGSAQDETTPGVFPSAEERSIRSPVGAVLP